MQQAYNVGNRSFCMPRPPACVLSEGDTTVDDSAEDLQELQAGLRLLPMPGSVVPSTLRVLLGSRLPVVEPGVPHLLFVEEKSTPGA